MRLLLAALVLIGAGGCAAGPGNGATVLSASAASAWSSVYRNAAVAADHPLASAAGAEMLQRGGNAVDAAVASSFCLSVVRPYSCGIGGGGFMLIHLPPDEENPRGRQVALNYRETAPSGVDRGYYMRLNQSGASRYGHHASGVPGTVAGLLYALEEYGTLDRSVVLAPAIRAAQEGFPADEDYVKACGKAAEALEKHPHLIASAEYIWSQLCHEGSIEAGEIITNPEQAEALRLIAAQGASAFYEGPIGEAIVETMRRHSGPITYGDLASYEIAVMEPLASAFLEYEVITMPPPSSGGIAMQQILGIIERWSLDSIVSPEDSSLYIHLLTEAMKHAFADRAQWLADSAFVDVPVGRLTSEAYLDELASRIRLEPRDPHSYGTVTPAGDDEGTSHISVIDSDGMAVSCTETINLHFGSLVSVPGFGFALNNEMDDFTTIPGEPNAFGLRQSDRNLPEPGKRPLSSMSPTIVLDEGRVVVIAGASGGPRIISGTAQALLNCLLFEMPASEAVSAPRFHHQWIPDVLQFEDRWEDAGLLEMMERMGHEVGRREEVGVVQLIRVTVSGIEAACDPRKGGAPAGL